MIFGRRVSHFPLYKGEYYVAATDGASGYELWTSDGTEAGTVQVKDCLARLLRQLGHLILRI